MTRRIGHAVRSVARALGASLRGGGLLSLAAPTAVVLGVLALAVASYTMGPSPAPPVAGEAAERPGLYLDSYGVQRPVAFVAAIYVDRWRDRAQRIIETRVTSATPVTDGVATGDATPSRLVGSRVLASVTDQAARDVPSRGPATVELVVLPNGQGATVVIDRVITGATAQAGAGTAKPATAVVDSLSLYAGAPGTSVTITGRGFGAQMLDSWVTCCGARATVTSWSATSVTFTVPTSAKRAGYVGVVVNSSTSNGLYFIPAAPPVLQDINPRQGAAGTIVTLTGRNFGAVRNGGWVTFAGSAAEVVTWSDSSIRVVVPKGATAGYAGVVANGLTSNGILYAPYGAPVVDGVSARRMTLGDVVTLTGRNFGTVAGDIAFAGTRLEPDSWSPSQVTFTVPDGMKSGYLGVIRPGGWTSNGVFVTVAPRVTSVSRWWAPPGASLTIRGVGFGSAQGASNAVVGGIHAAITSWSPVEITIQVPDEATSGYVGVATTEGSSNGIYLVVETQARLELAAPQNPQPGETVVLSGADFGQPSTANRVVVGRTYECEIVNWRPDRIEARIPAGCPSGYVGVVKHGVTSNGIWLTVGQ